ncbi:MAG: cytidylate kinase-like family protein [Eubacterium sp.]|nr:cytidylate kinase-like family protein [Eubacterium sp.]
MNQKITIAINREYGSGGRTIGEMIAKELGIHYYDKELVKLAAEDSGINEALFNKALSEFKGTPIFSLGHDIYDGKVLSPNDKDYTSPENLFACQAKVIRDLSERESCVVVGHGACHALKDRSNVVRVFVHAPDDFLLKQARLRLSMSDKELEKYVEKENKRRSEYFYYYTGEKWDDAHNYDLCLESSKLGFEKCCEIIKGYMKVRFDGLDFETGEF